MLLGQLMDRLGDDAFCAETLLSLDDLPLLVEVQAMGLQFGESASDYAAAAARRFAAFAGDEDWLALMTALERTPDPGAACLRQMLRWSLHHDSAACGCASNCTGEEVHE
jgi:hypothetical protein